MGEVTFLFHPHVVHFPVALLLTSLLFDVLFLLRREERFRTMALWLVALGVLAIPFVIALGFLDYTRQVNQGVGTAFVMRHRGHSATAYAASAIFAASLAVRWRRPQWVVLAFVLSAAGAATIAVAAYLGGELRGVM